MWLRERIRQVSKVLRPALYAMQKVPSACKHFPRFAKEFGIHMATVELIEEMTNRAVGYSDFYIEEASRFMQKELYPVVMEYRKTDNVPNFVDGKFDFNGKQPVFVCWWQGPEMMPPIVNACYNKICSVFETSETTVCLLTECNYKQYIEFPTYITEKRKKNLISDAAFSDILRWGLLSRYGGVWFDATDYIALNSIDGFRNQLSLPFFTQRFVDANECPNEPCRGLWCNFYLMGKHERNIRIFQFVYDSILYYWERHSIPFHYVWVDYIIWTGYQELDDIKTQIDNVPPNNKNIWKLLGRMNDAFDYEAWKAILSENDFYKLTYKIDLKRVTENGKMTVYGYLVSSDS